MSFRNTGGARWHGYQAQGNQQPDLSQSKAVSISEQERLIEQKKQEIQRKMAEKKKQKAEEAAKAGTAKKTSTGSIKFNIGQPKPPAAAQRPPAPAVQSPAAPPRPAAPPSAPAPVRNIFSNDGSFLEQFRKMQEQNAGQTRGSGVSSAPMLNQTLDLKDIPLPDSPHPAPDTSPPPSTLYAPTSAQPIAFSAAPTQARKTPLPVPKPSAFRDSDEEEEEGLNAILPPEDPELLQAINILAEEVAEGGLTVEETAKKKHKRDPMYEFLFDSDSLDHKYYQKRLVELRLAKKIRFVQEMRKSAGATSQSQGRKRKSRWIDSGPGESPAIPPPKITIIAPSSVGGGATPSKLPGVAGVGGTGTGLEGVEDNDWGFGASGGTSTSSLGSGVNSFGMIGTTELSAAQLKQLKEQQEMQRMVDSMVKYHNKIASTAPRQETTEGSTKKKNKYAYDSDEDTHGGTWEHKQRTQEMTETRERAEILTQMGRGKHHLGDFLPPDELEKFLETLEALKEGRTPDFSDYQKFKIQADNIGYQMLKKLGWEEGQGLGTEGQGITTPVNKGSASTSTTGLGIDKASNLTQEDAEDEFSAYRKRMMLAYRFRPNPLNNPRRPYY
ncbi:SURP and G-patch domain-containing protein 1-like [Asterias amurensis]|uniref:SURP and G-patch domain-containing protein 1-like n=1 Tax=Asterias amurensis TaxID=7602 RepID=UPI003AB77D94